MTVRLRSLALGTGAALLLTFLFVRTQAIDARVHDRYSTDLRRLLELDATLNQDLLRARDRLLPYYDPLVVGVTELDRVGTRLRRPPDFVGSRGQTALGRLLAEHRAALTGKEAVIEQFKSRHAVLRNSLDYLPRLAEEVAGGAPLQSRDPALARRLNRLLRDVLVYIQDADERRAAGIRAQIALLGKDRSRAASVVAGAELGTLLRHLEIILATQPQVDLLVREVLRAPTTDRAKALDRAYTARYEQALATTNVYRGWLYLFSVILVGAVANFMVRLRNYAVALKEANEGLEEKVRVRTRELQEEVVVRRRAEEQVERLLLNILPEAIATRLKADPRTIADSYDQVTVLFADIVDFTPLSARIPPEQLVELLNEVFSHFDRLAERHGLEKIKTIGDAYMVVGGLPEPRADHAEAVAEMALEMQAATRGMRRADDAPMQLRIGIHTGPVVAGVIGERKFSYDLWGDTVNLASRMESQGLPDRIQVTPASYERLNDRFEFAERGPFVVRGHGELKTWFLEGRKALPGAELAPDGARSVPALLEARTALPGAVFEPESANAPL